MVSKKVFLFFFLLSPILITAKEDPFSNITVKSHKATFKKIQTNPDTYRLEYDGDVSVDLADGTKVNSENLKVIVRPGNKVKQTETGAKALLGSSPEIDQILFQKHVKITRKNQEVTADQIEIVVAEKCCYAKGHVKIIYVDDTRVGDTSVNNTSVNNTSVNNTSVKPPLLAKCDSAKLCWEDDEIILQGEKDKPVCTRLVLGTKLGFLNKK